MKEWAEFITAVAALASALAWPLVTWCLVRYLLKNYKEQIEDFIGRLRKGKVSGVELELDSSAEELEKTTNEAVEDVKEKEDNSQESIDIEEEDDSSDETIDSFGQDNKDTITNNEETILQFEKSSRLYEKDIVEYLIQLSQYSPIAAAGSIAVLSSYIERELKELFAGLEIDNNYYNKFSGKIRIPNPRNAIREIAKAVDLPKSIIRSTDLFFDIRNKVLHSNTDDLSHETLISILSSGLNIYSSLRSIPRIIATVKQTDIDLFSDFSLQTPIEQYKGVLLEQKNSHSGIINQRIYPTRRNYYIGERVTLDYINKLEVPMAYYRDPENSEVKIAWHLASEFVGRNIKDT